MYRYRCTNGHDLRAPEPLARCVGCIDGQACDGTLRQTAGPRVCRFVAEPGHVCLTSQGQIAKGPQQCFAGARAELLDRHTQAGSSPARAGRAADTARNEVRA